MITLQNVSKVFGTGAAGLSDVSLHIDKGEFVFLVGHTGSGKTTLLRMLIREVTPSEGSVIVGGWDLNKLPGHKIPHLRKKIGVVFQDLKLLTDRTIFENIMLPLQVAGVAPQEAKNRVEDLLEQVGISLHRDKFPIQLSGGELQRAAIARALTLSPDILLADEPTGNLDTDTAFGIVALLSKINQLGTTIIMATHNMDIVDKLGNRVIFLEKGKLIKDEKMKKKETHPSHQKTEQPVAEKEEKKEHESHKKHAHHGKEEKKEKEDIKAEKAKEHKKEHVSMQTEEIPNADEKQEANTPTDDQPEAEKEEKSSPVAEAMGDKKKKRFSFFNRK